LTRGRCRLERPELDRRVQTLGRLVLPSRIYPCSVCSAEKRRLFFEQLTYSMTVISIQSQVAYGHVGNSAAVFPMQMRGIDVIVVPTTLLSNRPGYPTIRGRILDARSGRRFVGRDRGTRRNRLLPDCFIRLSRFAADRRSCDGIRHKGKEKQPKTDLLLRSCSRRQRPRSIRGRRTAADISRFSVPARRHHNTEPF
jgi:hypothetical protein